jgi:CrcB protein
MLSSLLGLLPAIGVFGFSTPDNPELRASIVISLGAIPGALSRYYITIWLAKWLGTHFPFGTFVINLSGALLIGFFATLTDARVIVPSDLQLLIIVGFLGSYTTFSTYALDTVFLLRSGSRFKSLLYCIGSIVLGRVCLKIGIIIAEIIR